MWGTSEVILLLVSSLLQSPKLRMYFLNSLSEFIYLDFFICFVHFVGLAHLSLLCPILNSVRV